MTTIEINNRYYSVPQQWNELSKEQLLQVMAVLYAKDYPAEKALLKLLKILTGMSWWAFFRAPITSGERYRFNWRNLRLSLGLHIFLCRVPYSGLDEYLHLPQFLLDKNNLTKNLLPAYRGFYGPADGLNNLVMEEFVFSEHFFMQWAENAEDETLLNNLVAVLYRPGRKFYNKRKNAKGDVRIDFNENLSAYHAERVIAKWPMAVKLAVAHMYGACRAAWIDDNAEVFSGSSGEPAKYGLITVMRGVAKGGIYGDMEAVGKRYVNAILMELNEMVIEAREYERAMKR